MLHYHFFETEFYERLNMPHYTLLSDEKSMPLEPDKIVTALQESGLDIWRDTKGKLHFVPEGASGGYNMPKKWAARYLGSKPSTRCPHCNKLLDIETMKNLPVVDHKGPTIGMPLDVQKELLDILCVPKGANILSYVKALMTINDGDSLTAEAVAKVRGPREKEYGDMLTNFTDIANLENAAHGLIPQKHEIGCGLRTAETVAIDNICQKLARLRKSPDHYDTLVDIIGYVLCYRDIRRARNPEHYEKEEARFSAENNSQVDHSKNDE